MTVIEFVFFSSCSRCQLLLQAYKTTIEEDTALLSGGGGKQLSLHSVLAIKIRLSEKKILHNAVLFARTLKESLLNQPLGAEAHGLNGGAHEMTQPTGNLGGATNSVPVVLEIDSEGGEHEAKQPTGNMAGVTDSVPVVVEIDDEASSDQNGDEPEVQQTTGNLVGAANNVPVVVESKNEVSSETSGLIKPGETVESEQVNGEVDNELPKLRNEKSEEGERERKPSEEGRREREETEEVVGVKGGGGKVEGQGGGCPDDEGGGGGGGGVSEKTDLEQTNQCVNGNE